MSAIFATVSCLFPCLQLTFPTFYTRKSGIIVPVPTVLALPEFFPLGHRFTSSLEL
jgi:hypothetical protein